VSGNELPLSKKERTSKQKGQKAEHSPSSDPMERFPEKGRIFKIGADDASLFLRAKKKARWRCETTFNRRRTPPSCGRKKKERVRVNGKKSLGLMKKEAGMERPQGNKLLPLHFSTDSAGRESTKESTEPNPKAVHDATGKRNFYISSGKGAQDSSP